MKPVRTDDAVQPRGHYSQGMVHGDLVWVSGQLALAPGAPDAPPPDDMGEQTRMALANVGAILDAAGSGIHRAVQITLYVSDIDRWGEVNEAYAAVLGEHRPTRAVIPVGRLPRGFLVEIQAVGVVGEPDAGDDG